MKTRFVMSLAGKERNVLIFRYVDGVFDIACSNSHCLGTDGSTLNELVNWKKLGSTGCRDICLN